MAESILKIHTQNGDIPVGYPGLANKPIADKTLSVEGAFADSKAVGDKFKQVKAETDSLKEDKADKTALAKTDRKLDALWKLNQGISYEFQTDDTEAYQKTVPTGAKMANVKSIGGKTICLNQLVNPTDSNKTKYGVDITRTSTGNISVHGTVTESIPYNQFNLTSDTNTITFKRDGSTKYLVKINKNINKKIGVSGYSANSYKSFIFSSADGGTWNGYIYAYAVIGDEFDVDDLNICVFDLTQMFGAGNEPSTPEEFEAMFPADYYAYNTGELMSAPVNEVVEQGKNLLNYDAWKGVPITRGTAVFEKNSFALTATENDCYTEPMQKDGFPDDAKIEISEGETVTLSWESSADIDGVIYIYPNGVTDGMVYTNNHSAKALTYTATRGVKFITFRFGVSYAGNTVSYKNIQIEKKAKATSYEPYHRTTHAIPQSILQLDGYGESGNFVDFVEKKYHKGDRTIDISDIIGDTFQEPLEVEAGGTLIFKNSHGDDYRIPVPSSEEYVISLAEVAK